MKILRGLQSENQLGGCSGKLMKEEKAIMGEISWEMQNLF